MLEEIRNSWKEVVESELRAFAEEKGVSEVAPLQAGTPPKAELGDIAFPLFQYSKALRMAPAQIAAEIKARLEKKTLDVSGELLLAGPYLNVKLEMGSIANKIRTKVESAGEKYGHNDSLKGKKVMIEFSCPNTNKPLHLGHMRNDSLGMSVANLLSANGAEVKRVNLINNRGVHICKSMWAYKTFGNGETPESTGEKGDHFVGRYYVRYAQYEKECIEKALLNAGDVSEEEREKIKAEAAAKANEEPQSMLLKWEQNDPEVMALWNKMNQWTLDGLATSYKNMGIEFEKYYYESDTYKYGKDQVYKGLDMGVFYKAEDGSVQIDLSPIGLDKKVLLRKDGTSIYMTQDLGTAVNRHSDWPFDSLIYVVASEQQYHFKVLFYCLKMLGYKWADELYHLSYGMVNLPNGRMKSREGTVVDADDLLENLSELAKEEIIAKEREELVGDVDSTSRKIALGALNYYLLQVTPAKDMIFNPQESISFNGNTGPYLQYMGARISSMMMKFEEVKKDYEGISFDGNLLKEEDEKTIIKLIASFPEVVKRAGSAYDPSIICAFLYDLSKTFSHYYHDNQILKAETKELVVARVELSRMVLTVLKNAYALVGVPFLASM
ncbi:MAG: arginine--tRNA ligase [Sphaerochaetaceae bacterium]|nr:arginine--tRNA ligase [Sphaerochaetaceae bacterium]